jgi:hypothetical protein
MNTYYQNYITVFLAKNAISDISVNNHYMQETGCVLSSLEIT